MPPPVFKTDHPQNSVPTPDSDCYSDRGFFLHPPQTISDYFQQRDELRKRRGTDPKKYRLASIYPGLLTYLQTFIDPREMGIKLPADSNPRPFISTETLNQRIGQRQWSGFLSNLELHHHQLRNYRMYFCNSPTSKYIYPYLDFDNAGHQHHGDSAQAVAFIKHELNLDAFDQPSTRGHGLYPKIGVSTNQPEEIRRALLDFADALNLLLKANGYQSTVEAKALPSIREFPSGLIPAGGRGILGRLPLFESLEDFQAFKAQPEYELESLQDLTTLLFSDFGDGLPTTRRTPTLPTPSARARKARKAKRTQPLPLPTPDEEPNARERMLTNGFEFRRQYRRTPTVEELLAFYAAGPSARQPEETAARVHRAEGIVKFLASSYVSRSQKHHKHVPFSGTQTTPTTLPFSGTQQPSMPFEAVRGEIEAMTSEVKSARVRMREVKMQTNELVVLYAVAVHNFFNNENHRCPRNAIEAVWTTKQEEGFISRRWREDYYQAGLKVLVDTQLLEIAAEHVRPWFSDRGVTDGKARVLAPGVRSTYRRQATPILQALREEPPKKDGEEPIPIP